MSEAEPQMSESNESTDEVQAQKAKWISSQLAEDPSKTVEELSAQYDEKRTEILTEGGYEEHDYTVTTGKQEGAGTVEMGLERPEEKEL